MLSAVVLAATAFVAGVTGAWSPCGFSMVETLGGPAAVKGRRVTLAACATFTAGAIAGGVVTFGLLSALGHLLHGRGAGIALAVAVAIAVLAAAGEAAGVRIVPQIRRQVPERWRRIMPLPVAAGLYGVLLGLGFTTFVLTLAVWALAGVSVALGSVAYGVLIGVAFGVGRALPVVVMAPRFDTVGERLATRMAEQPLWLRGLRVADATLLATVAVVLATTGTALAAGSTRLARSGTDPSAAGLDVAWAQPGGGAVVRHRGAQRRLRAQTVALGGPYLATRVGDRITVTDRRTGRRRGRITAGGADHVAISDRWLVWRAARRGGGDRIVAARLPGLRARRFVTGIRAAGQLSRPSVDGNRLVYAASSSTGSHITAVNLRSGHRQVVRRSALTQLGNPAVRGDLLLYEETDFCTQTLRLAPLAGRGRLRGRILYRTGVTARRDEGHDPDATSQGSEPGRCPGPARPRSAITLWTAALGPGAAYLTLVRPRGGARAAASVIRLPVGG